MPWIESHTVLLRHRKVLQLADDLQVPPVQVIGHLHALWHAVLEQQEDGDLSEWPDSMIAQAAAYVGDAQHFVACLQLRKWLDDKIVHDWLEYAGRYLAVKYRTANPAKLQKIHKTHKSVYKSVSSQTKVSRIIRLKSDNQPNLTNQPNQPEEEQAAPPALRADLVVERWNKIVGVRKVEQLTGELRKRVESRIREHQEETWWESLFEKIGKSPFLTGAKTDFAATLDWALGPKNLSKILAGNYANTPTGAAPTETPCQERVYRGNFLKPCGQPSVTMMGGRPLCQEHKEYHEKRRNHTASA